MAIDDLVKVHSRQDPRPPEYFEPYHERARRRAPDGLYEVVRMVLTPVLTPLYRIRPIGTDHVPASGPVILAPNHFSFADHFFLAIWLRRRVHFMAKSQLFVKPFDFIFLHGGVFPVRRGHSDEEAIRTAHAVLDRGDPLVMYAEGGRSRTGGLGQPRRGVGRIALESGAPVVPTAIHGSQHVKHVKRLRFPKVTVQFGEVMQFERLGYGNCTPEQAQDASQEIFDRISTMWNTIEDQGRRAVLQQARAARAV